MKMIVRDVRCALADLLTPWCLRAVVSLNLDKDEGLAGRLHALSLLYERRPYERCEYWTAHPEHRP